MVVTNLVPPQHHNSSSNNNLDGCTLAQPHTRCDCWLFFKQGFGVRIHWFRIRIQQFRFNTDPDTILIQGFGEQKFEKNFDIFFSSKIAIYPLSLGLHKERPSFRRSLQPSKENIQHFTTWNFLTFLYFLGHFCPPGSDLDSESVSESTDLIESGSETLILTDWIRIRRFFVESGSAPRHSLTTIFSSENLIYEELPRNRNSFQPKHAFFLGGEGETFLKLYPDSESESGFTVLNESVFHMLNTVSFTFWAKICRHYTIYFSIADQYWLFNMLHDITYRK